MMEWIRSYIMSRFSTLREKLNGYLENVMPRPKKRLDREMENKMGIDFLYGQGMLSLKSRRGS